MKKGKKIAIIIGIIVIILAAIFAIMIVKDLKQEETLTNELNSLYDLLEADSLNYDEIDQKLNQTVTTNDYYILETSIKSYMSNVFNSLKELETLVKDEKVQNILTPSNIKVDGPKFTKTSQTLNDAKNKLDKIYSNLDTYFTEETAMSYIENKQLDDYYIKLYKKYLFEDNIINITDEKKEIRDSLNKIKNILNKEQEIIDFLVDNKKNWELDDDTLVFYSQSLSDKYNQLINELDKE